MAGRACVQKNSLCATMITVDWASPDSETQVARKESRSTTVNHHDWTQTLLARDELDVWPGLRPQGRAFPRQKTSSLQECQRTQTRVRQGRRAPAPRSVTGRACWRMQGLKNTVACQSSCWCPPVLGLVARQFLGWCPQVYGSATLRNVPVRLFSRVGILRCRVAHSTVVCVATATRQNDNKRHVSSGFTKQPLGPTTSHGKNLKKTNIFHCFRRQHGTGKLRTTLPHIKLVFELRTHVCGQRCRTP